MQGRIWVRDMSEVCSNEEDGEEADDGGCKAGVEGVLGTSAVFTGQSVDCPGVL